MNIFFLYIFIYIYIYIYCVSSNLTSQLESRTGPIRNRTIPNNRIIQPIHIICKSSAAAPRASRRRRTEWRIWSQPRNSASPTLASNEWHERHEREINKYKYIYIYIYIWIYTYVNIYIYINVYIYIYILDLCYIFQYIYFLYIYLYILG